ncbi:MULTISPECIES: DUF4294 domain-containing protein [unclassified Capnocytophaga]|uniref:DUF4294 domain-containing protein n=1 Tax=unclassified Capnocytophaga TaxID=2640652 RepID=UPI000202FBB1|nr:MULTISPECIES: DUF4294 domain-containing protein [unclassified Capnocytophaga]EGD33723.1 hypothetical protein HMPREF9071_1885 [Capnocytophaga sp. oral taxon 338 str. F0234]MEB3004549.1 DUF4294 domain-containing protein [Capnocytophaga sp. G2]
MRISFFILSCLGVISSFAQERDTIIKIDSIAPNETIINLEEVLFFGSQPFFKNEEQKKKYELLRSRVKKVYPYAKLAADKLYRIERVLDTLPSKRQKKKYTKKVQEDAEARFTVELKKLSRSQGKILIKLIYRQTGESAYNLVKNLRSGWRAFWYNNTAWFYDLSLKSTYNPEEVEEDFWIEDILLRAFSQGELEMQPAAIYINYEAIEKKWRNP